MESQSYDLTCRGGRWDSRTGRRLSGIHLDFPSGAQARGKRTVVNAVQVVDGGLRKSLRERIRVSYCGLECHVTLQRTGRLSTSFAATCQRPSSVCSVEPSPEVRPRGGHYDVHSDKKVETLLATGSALRVKNDSCIAPAKFPRGNSDYTSRQRSSASARTGSCSRRCAPGRDRCRSVGRQHAADGAAQGGRGAHADRL